MDWLIIIVVGFLCGYFAAHIKPEWQVMSGVQEAVVYLLFFMMSLGVVFFLSGKFLELMILL